MDRLVLYPAPLTFSRNTLDLPHFIATERTGAPGEAGEEVVWDAVKSAFAKRNALAYWHYPVFPKFGTRKEPDILALDQELGIVIIEVKSIRIEQLVEVNGHKWGFKNFYTNQDFPFRQAESQLWSLLAYCEQEPALKDNIAARTLVALPYVHSESWLERGFAHLPSCQNVICEDNLGRASLLNTIRDASPAVPGLAMDDTTFQHLLGVVSGTTLYRKRGDDADKPERFTGRGTILQTAREQLHKLDLQQETIAKQIPPGPQRIRGIAGSGKTVMLCQKAAQMHLKHPEWDVALVFFTRSLYDTIVSNVDKWMRHYTGGERGYEPANSHLKVLHAWGAKDQAGFYRELAYAHGLRPKHAMDPSLPKHLGPTQKYAYLLKSFLEDLAQRGKKVQPLFDVLLVDEGQDLVFGEEFKYEDKQPFYYLAYQSLRPVKLAAVARKLFEEEAPNPMTAKERRLIWAYDEAQSLDSLVIPSYKEVFGEDISREILSGGVHYYGSIAKNEVMQRCYRTPGPILVAAHAVGMGLLRPEGPLSALTTKEDWRKLGYEVEGDFRKLGSTITLRRPEENSPNVVPNLYQKNVLTFYPFSSRSLEIETVAEQISQDLEEGLKPSRDILVVTLGFAGEVKILQEWLGKALRAKGINFFIPSATQPNVLSPEYPDKDPNAFWHDGAVTLSGVYQAKGNEADVVYVVGLDHIAKREADISYRNQLFVALTRSRGWAHVSGVGQHGMFEELRQVLRSGETITFTYTKAPQRLLQDE